MLIKDFLKNIIFDNSCILCKNKKLSKKISFICDDCLKSFENKFVINVCKICFHPLNEFGKCTSCNKLGEIYIDSYKFIQYYNDYFKSVIYKLKIQEDFMINRLFYRLLILKKLIQNDGIITVVPDSFYKRIKKGRSSLYYILKLLKKDGYKTIYNIYKRNINFKKSQKNKMVKERLEEIKNLYYLPRKNYNKFTGTVYLIDDIYTTGSTLNYGAKLLKLAGFKNVHAVSFFRARLNE